MSADPTLSENPTETTPAPISSADLGLTRRRVWGLPLAVVRREEVPHLIDAMIATGRAGYFITATLHYAMIVSRRDDLGPINEQAAFITADGMPLVVASKYKKRPLPERVCGSDLIFDLSEHAARCGHRIFLLGAPPGVAEEAAAKLTERYPGLTIAGVECPPFRPLTEQETAELIGRIREARTDILLVAFGQPKGEIWIREHLEALGVPVCAQVGASIEFAAGRVSRAPRWMQKTGLEWFYRFSLEPRRLAGRYAANATFLAGRVLRDFAGAITRRDPDPEQPGDQPMLSTTSPNG